MTSPPGPCSSLRAASVSRLADEPELTKTLYLTPSQSRPFLLEGADVGRLRQDGVVLLQQCAHGVEVLAGDVVLHQRPIEAGRVGGRCCVGHQNGPLNSMLWRSGRSSGSQPRRVALPRGRGRRRRWSGRWGRTVLPERASSDSRRREAHAAEAQVAHALEPLGHLGDDLGGRPAAEPAGIDHQQPAGPFDRHRDRVDVERAEPDRDRSPRRWMPTSSR